MKATIELSDAHGAMLLEIAAEPGDDGLAAAMTEALDLLASSREESARRARVERALEALDGFDPAVANRMAQRIAEARNSWRSSD